MFLHGSSTFLEKLNIFKAVYLKKHMEQSARETTGLLQVNAYIRYYYYNFYFMFSITTNNRCKAGVYV